MTVACVLWNLDVPTRLGVALLTEQYLALQLGLAICIVFLSSTFTRASVERAGAVNATIAVVGLLTLLYTAWNYVALLREQAFRPPVLTWVGTAIVLCVVEGVRRRAGKALFIIVGLFLLYALFAHKMPGVLIGREMKPVALVQYVGFDPSAAFSLPLTVASVIVILFVFFGKLLFAAGGGRFFTESGTTSWGRSPTVG